MKRIPWNERQPAHFQVHAGDHCCISSSAHYVQTIQRIHVATDWSEQVSTLGRSHTFMQHRLTRILAHIAFPLLRIHPDDGSDFLNAHLGRLYSTHHLFTSFLSLRHDFPPLRQGGGWSRMFFT
jgi:hypothetical protein